jgi:L-ascorbate metabolism protein UlaG (beta-lactamase superfamily)
MQENSPMTHIWYLFHSGFAVKTARHFLIFDYYLDTPEKSRQGLDGGVITPEELQDLKVVVFSSHQHHDHYNPVILKWQQYARDIQYVLSDDIKIKHPVKKVLMVHPGSYYEQDGIKTTVLHSTDEGAAFLVEVDGLVLFHAGDLNWWHWEGEPEDENRLMGENYRKQINLLKGRHIDLAFIPVDPRLEEQYLWGLDYFMKTAGANQVFPMHFGKEYSIFERLKTDPEAAAYLDKITEIHRRGQHFVY